jgi:hypothetical protein
MVRLSVESLRWWWGKIHAQYELIPNAVGMNQLPCSPPQGVRDVPSVLAVLPR